MADPVTPRAPRELMALARELVADNVDRREILQRCYGVAFPEEVFVVLDARPDGLGETHLPWALVSAEELADEARCLALVSYVEDKVYAIDRELVPLCHGQSILCYRLDHLATGRATVFALPREFDDYTEATRAADSLLAALHEQATRAVQHIENEYNSPGNRGAGSVDLEEVQYHRRCLEDVERMRLDLAARLVR
jgi:hypothetical protein